MQRKAKGSEQMGQPVQTQQRNIPASNSRNQGTTILHFPDIEDEDDDAAVVEGATTTSPKMITGVVMNGLRDQLYKIGLPGKSILRDHFQEKMTSRRPRFSY